MNDQEHANSSKPDGKGESIMGRMLREGRIKSLRQHMEDRRNPPHPVAARLYALLPRQVRKPLTRMRNRRLYAKYQKQRAARRRTSMTYEKALARLRQALDAEMAQAYAHDPNKPRTDESSPFRDRLSHDSPRLRYHEPVDRSSRFANRRGKSSGSTVAQYTAWRTQHTGTQPDQPEQAERYGTWSMHSDPMKE